MDIHIGEVQSNVYTSDEQSVLSPRVMHQIVQAVLAELREQQAYKARREADRSLSGQPAANKIEEVR